MIMATFQSWLADQLVRPETDPVGWLARQWKAHEGNRPRVSSPTGIGRFLEEQAGEDQAAKGYVNEAVKAATTAYRERDAGPVVTRDGEPANAAAEQAAAYHAEGLHEAAAIVERNAVTGKPVAVVPGSAWITHPDATQFGTCTTCGWPRGLAGATTGAMGSHITCAAGHIFTPEKPGSPDVPPPVAGAVDRTMEALDRGEDDRTNTGGQAAFTYGPGALAPGGAGGGISWPGEDDILIQPPAQPLAPGPVQPPPEDECIGADDQPHLDLDDLGNALEQVITMQGMLLHIVTRIAQHIGLPAETLDAFVDGSVAAATGPVTQVAPPAPWVPDRAAELAAQAPGDLSSQLYGLPAAGQGHDAMMATGADDETFPIVCANGCPEGYLGRHKFSCPLAGQAPQPPNDPQAFASWFNAAEYGDPGNG
jgi:hypothetical protein